MAHWQATNAKAKFSALLDAAEAEGPQLIRRRKLRFVVMTEEEIERQLAEAREGRRTKFISAWDALKPSFDERYDDVDFPRVDLEPRSVDLG